MRKSGVNKKNKNMRGKGVLSDIYRVGAKALTGENVPRGNPYSTP